MAVSGGVLFLFVVGHLAGNLQIFLGAEAINRYGHFLQSNPELIWPARLDLMLMLALHVWSAVLLSLEKHAARPVPYADFEPVATNFASRNMLMTGFMVFAFIAYHLLHYTVQVKYINLTGQSFTGFMDAEHRHDIFKMMVVGFRNGWVSAFYIVAIGLLCLHLSHGASSMFQSLGLKNATYRPFLDLAAKVVSFVLFLGYISIPVAILLGFGKEALL